jgi:chromosome segregation ATPase
MQITSLEIRNYLGITVFKVSELGKLNQITGANGAGKSSLVKAIKEAFKSSGRDPHVIKSGTKTAEILIELDNKILVERKITSAANTAKVTVDGQPLDSPTAYLKALLGEFIFGPINFFQASKKERRRLLLSSIPFKLDPETLAEHLGNSAKVIDLSKFDYSVHGLECLKQIQEKVYEMRHDQNSIVTRLKKSIEQDQQEIPETFDGDKFTDFDVNAATEQLSQAQGQIAKQAGDRQRLETLRARAESISQQIESLQAELAEVNAEGKTLKDEVLAFVQPDVQELRENLSDYHQHQELALKKKAIDKRVAELGGEQSHHANLDSLHKQLTTEIPKELLQEVKLPVEGLEIDGDEILVGGVAIDKLSTSEQLRFAVRVARALAGKLKVICCDQWESLDKESMAAFLAEAADDDFEYFITRVTDGELKLEKTDSAPLAKTATPKKDVASPKKRVEF